MVADQVESFINELQERTSNGRLVWNPVSGLEDWEKKKHRIEKSEDIELKDYFIEDDQSYVIEKNGAYVMLLRLRYGNAAIFSPALDKYILVAQINEEIPLENLSGYDCEGFEKELEKLLQLIEDKRWEKYEMPDDLHRFFDMILEDKDNGDIADK